MGHTAAVFGKGFHFLVINIHGVGEPDILPHPVDRLHVRDRPVTELLQAESLLILGFGQMRVQVHGICACQPGRLLHQLPGHAERRARRQDNLDERARFRIVVGFDQALAVAQDVLFRIHHRIGRQPALRFAQRHGTARGLDAHTDFPGSRNLIIQPGAVREQVQVIRGGGAARKGQFGQGGLGGNENILRRHARPDGVERLEPVEQVGILGGRHGARQGLVEMVVSIDQPRQYQVAGEIEHFIRPSRQFAGRTDLFDEAVPDKKTTVRNLPAAVIHRYQYGSIFYQ